MNGTTADAHRQQEIGGIAMFYQRTSKEYIPQESSKVFALGTFWREFPQGIFQGNDPGEIPRGCLGIVGHGQFLEMFHEHL